MSVEKAKQFLKEYRNNKEAMKIMKQFSEPKSSDEAIAQFVETAGKLGTRITKEDMAKAIRELTEEMKAKTDAAADDLQAMDDDDLEEAAGGVYFINPSNRRQGGCAHEFTEEECFWHDACETANVRYYDCEGKWHPNRGEYDCKVLHYFCDKYWECDHTGILG